ncbi:Fumarate reductase flavoprotein subunit [Andreprevotia sp. IGB-42]|uniref:FAD-dependent oxidoreductase n=1 Tax=Andreprevotia sp. IGB-42 TaxID=2497473 RepID=UPI00135B850B|nr:FAD-binding protein [Andreprevotia sp. IGB-42]KAF0812654.1 Fumarate reductase flavoprotein subunit [Andreprevotia sp. IGB-42]
MRETLQLEADVLVLGGGLAGTWAAVAAARSGARVILADKGYCGTSGVTATAGPGHWWVPPDPALRSAAIEKRLATAFGLADPAWMARIIELTWQTLPTLAGYYDFPQDDAGVTQYRGLRGPEYMRAMRRLALDQGVQILDQSPALELLLLADGAVAGARGHQRQLGQDWQVRSGAVVVATGGCAFLSHLLGAHTNTGDGYLMAAEAGAALSGMEFTTYYTVAPVHTSMTRSMSYAFATYYDAAGHELPIPPGPGSTDALARALLQGTVFCSLHKMPADVRAQLPRISPNVMLPFARQGIDPYTQRFEVTLRGEGTVRGIGGLDVVSDDCATRVPGLYAAGDAATRELIAGATSGGGAQNSAWALSSGHWAGQGAARHARSVGIRTQAAVQGAGEAGLRPRTRAAPPPLAAVRQLVTAEMLPLDKNYFRTGAGLRQSLTLLDDAWQAIRDSAGVDGADRMKWRETAALVASGRWSYRGALARAESRGMHHRLDHRQTDAALAHRLVQHGVDQPQWQTPVSTPQPEEQPA